MDKLEREKDVFSKSDWPKLEELFEKIKMYHSYEEVKANIVSGGAVD